MNDTNLGRIVAVLTSPSKTFQAIAERPTWLAPFLVINVLTAVCVYITVPNIDWQQTIQTKLERSDREVPAERIEPFIALLQEHGQAWGLVWTAVSPWIIYSLMAAIFASLLRRMGGELSFRTSLGVLTHGFMPSAVATLISIPFLLSSENLNLYDPEMTSSLAAFADAETSLELWILLTSVNLFSLWTIALLVIGYSIAAKISHGRAAACVVGLWAAWVASMVGMAALD